MMRVAKPESGQASIEYLLVGLVLLALMGALSTLWKFIASGGLTAFMQANASHAMHSFGGLCDALLF